MVTIDPYGSNTDITYYSVIKLSEVCSHLGLPWDSAKMFNLRRDTEKARTDVPPKFYNYKPKVSDNQHGTSYRGLNYICD
jgi:hypothetical protein